MASDPQDMAARLRHHLEVSLPPGLISAYLFGSHAAGRAHRESDVDVAVLLAWTTHPTARDRFEVRVRLGADLAAALRTEAVRLCLVVQHPTPRLQDSLRVPCQPY